jgi:hypothetical protein
VTVLKLARNANSDGLIKRLRQRQDSFVTNPNIYAPKFCSIYKMLWHLDSFISRDSIIGAVGRRSGALFFARHRDYFIVTRNFTVIYRDLVPSKSFIVTRNSVPSTRTGKKRGTATQSAPNQTAGPLVSMPLKKMGIIVSMTVFSLYQDLLLTSS